MRRSYVKKKASKSVLNYKRQGNLVTSVNKLEKKTNFW